MNFQVTSLLLLWIIGLAYSQECSEGCAKCDGNGANCDTCRPGYFRKLEKTCRWCPIGCKMCDNEKSCIACQSNYFKKDGQCLDCPANCLSCSSMMKCTTCAKEFFLKKISQNEVICQYCPSGCKECDSGVGACLECKEGYFPTEQNTCEDCPPNCKQCQNYKTCITCMDGFLLTDSQCESCPANCKSCRNSTSCMTCMEGYYMDETGRCEDCPLNCKSCNKDGVCETCDDGFILTSSKKCRVCPANCQHCDQDVSCTTCKDGFWMKEEHVCKDICYHCGDVNNFIGDCGLDAANATYEEEKCARGNCWVQRQQVGDLVTFFRGCLDDECSHEFMNEKCYQASENKTICSKCCRGPRCNSFTLDGVAAGVTLSLNHLLLLICSALYLHLTC